MASTVSKAANANAVVTTGWTNATNAYADDTNNATCSPGKGATVDNDFKFPNFTTSDIPDTATISSVTATMQAWGANAALTESIQGRVSGANSGSAATTTTTVAQTATTCTFGTVTLANLRAAATDIAARVGSSRTGNTAYTATLDYVFLTVTFTDNKVAVPGAASLVASGATPAVTAPAISLPSAAALVLTGDTPAIDIAAAAIIAVPDAASLSVTGSTPIVTAPAVSQPGAASLSLSASTPVVSAAQTYEPTAASLVASGATPAVSAAQTYLPAAVALTLAGDTPAIALPVVAAPDAAALVVTSATPTITAPAISVPDAAALELTGTVPAIVMPVGVAPDAASLALAGGTPAITVGAPRDDKVCLPEAAALAFSLYAPDVIATENVSLTPAAAALSLAGFAPAIALPVWAEPTSAALVLTGFVPRTGESVPLPDVIVAVIAAQAYGGAVHAHTYGGTIVNPASDSSISHDSGGGGIR